MLKTRYLQELKIPFAPIFTREQDRFREQISLFTHRWTKLDMREWTLRKQLSGYVVNYN